MAAPTADAPLKKPFLVRVFTEPIWVLGLVILVDEADKNIVRGLVTPLKEDLGVGDLGIAVLLSMALLFNGLITVPAGYLADRWMRTRAIGHTVIGWSAITAAGVFELISGSINLMRQVREVQVEDVLGREPVTVEVEQAGSYLADRTVIVTGAGAGLLLLREVRDQRLRGQDHRGDGGGVLEG